MSANTVVTIFSFALFHDQEQFFPVRECLFGPSQNFQVQRETSLDSRRLPMIKTHGLFTGRMRFF